MDVLIIVSIAVIVWIFKGILPAIIVAVGLFLLDFVVAILLDE